MGCSHSAEVEYYPRQRPAKKGLPQRVIESVGSGIKYIGRALNVFDYSPLDRRRRLPLTDVSGEVRNLCDKCKKYFTPEENTAHKKESHCFSFGKGDKVEVSTEINYNTDYQGEIGTVDGWTKDGKEIVYYVHDFEGDETGSGDQRGTFYMKFNEDDLKL